MRRLVIAGFFVLLGGSGCSSMRAPGAGSEAAPHPDTVAGPPAAPQTSPIPSPPAVPRPPPPTQRETIPAPTTLAPITPPVSAAPNSTPAKTKPPAISRPAAPASAVSPVRPAVAQSKPQSPSAASQPTAQPSQTALTNTSPATSPPTQSLPSLNLHDLEQRLRDTRAIGVFAKLSLKNQVDDLLSAFREIYRVPNRRPPAELRQRYDLLMLKVLSLLQDGDPPLASAIASSREAIWSILADPDKFSKI